jgi:flagellar hook-associated protein 2
MSTQPISTTSTNNSTSPFQITGLASGLNTNAIIAAEMAVARQPVTDLTNQENGLQTLDTQLTSIQASLQTVANDAQSLGFASLFNTYQTVTSSNPSLITASTGVGAGVGGYEVSVTQLANSSQRTFTFASPSAADTITIDGHQVAVPPGATIQQFISTINSDPNADVYAAATNSSTVVLSSRATGDTGSSFIQVSDPNGAIVEQSALAKQGRNAQFSVDGISGTSMSNTVTNAIAGVSLQLGGVTPSGSPVTVTVSAPAPSTTNVVAAVNQFVSDYNATISQIETQLSQKPVSGAQSQGTLFGDSELRNLLNQMRRMIYTPGSGLPSGMAALSDMGVSTGDLTNATSQGARNGILTIDQAALQSAVQSNPSGVETMLQQWSHSFTTLVHNEAAPGGTIGGRIQGNTSEISQMNLRISAFNTLLTAKQKALTLEFANLESTLAKIQGQGNAFASVFLGTTTSSTSSSSSSSHA